MLKKIGIAVAALLAAFIVFVLTRPEDFVVERTVSMNAPPDVAYATIADFHRWTEWSPWDKMDTNLKREYDGAATGVGANYHWVGEKTGEGRMTITDAKPGDHVTIKLDFIKPFASTSTASFLLKGSGPSTAVTWRMEGKNEGFVRKMFSTFMNMDKMVGGQFQEGLETMKKVAEADVAKKAAAPAPAPAAAAEAAPTAPPAEPAH